MIFSSVLLWIAGSKDNSRKLLIRTYLKTMRHFFAAIFFSLILSGLPPRAEADMGKAVLVWAEKNPSGRYDIYLQSMQQGEWGKAVVVSSTDEVQTRPAAARDTKDNIWVVWTRLKTDRGTIHYRYYSADEKKWQQERGLPTKTGWNLPSDLAVDRQGDIWLTYGGSRPGLSNIYLTAWNGNGWDQPFQVNTEDRSPDVNPHFRYAGNGRLSLIWKGFYRGGYTLYRSTLEESRWSEEELLKGKEQEKVKIRQQQRSAEKFDILPKLPGTLQPTNQGFLYFMGLEHPESYRFDK
ncbi:MAG: hypothetical protein JRJ68_09965 [Deltaproteobacteria bacterium]|nr:hypothetical protein [Deltaproteobacteria bacterium]